MHHLTLIELASLIQAAGTIFIALTFVIYWHQLGAMRKQLEDNRRTNQTSQYQAALQLMFDWRSDLISNPQLAHGFEDSPYYAAAFSIMPIDQYFHTMKLFHVFQHYWLLNNLEVIDKRIWDGWAKNIEINMQVELHQKIWNKLKEHQVFDTPFVSFIDNCVTRSSGKIS